MSFYHSLGLGQNPALEKGFLGQFRYQHPQRSRSGDFLFYRKRPQRFGVSEWIECKYQNHWDTPDCGWRRNSGCIVPPSCDKNLGNGWVDLL